MSLRKMISPRFANPWQPSEAVCLPGHSANPAFANPWQKRAKFAKHWQIAGGGLLVWVLLFLFGGAGEAAAQRLGPYRMEFKVGPRVLTNEVSIIRREKDTLWVAAAGSRGGETGVAVKDIRRIHVPTPESLKFAGQMLELPVPADERQKIRYNERMKQVMERLDRDIKMFGPYRTLPGIPGVELQFMKARLLASQGKWAEALKMYESLLDYLKSDDPHAVQAQIQAGIIYAREGDHLTAIEYLAPLEPPLDDERLLSDMLFALGDAYAAMGNHDDALMSYLPLLVFHPFVYHNEPRALEKVLPCYAALAEWEPMLRTIRWIKRDYAGSPAEKTADEFLKTYAAELGSAREFVDDESED